MCAVCKLSVCATKSYNGIINFTQVIVSPLQAGKAVRGGDTLSAKRNTQKALCCNITSVVCAVIVYISLLIGLILFFFAARY